LLFFVAAIVDASLDPRSSRDDARSFNRAPIPADATVGRMRAFFLVVVLATIAGCSAPNGLKIGDGDESRFQDCSVGGSECPGGTARRSIVDGEIAARCLPDDVCADATCIVGECFLDDDAPIPHVRCVCGDDVRCSKASEEERDAELRDKGYL
jgi:hypothetical protein